MCYTVIPGETGCLAIRDLPQTPKLKKSATALKKKTLPLCKSCGQTSCAKTLSRDEECDKDNRKVANMKAKNAKRNQHHFKHLRKDVVEAKRAACF